MKGSQDPCGGRDFMVRYEEGWVQLACLPTLPAFHAYLADKGGIGEGGSDVSVLVELVILGQF